MAKLLSASFQGRDALRQQLRDVLVEKIDDEGSLRLRTGAGPKASVLHRVPLEAEAVDSDGVALHVLLHVVDGRLNELEIYREDGARVLELPPVDSWVVR